MSGWTVYVLRCSDDTFYTGITNDLDRRIQNHNDGNGAKYTRGRGPVHLYYTENNLSHSEAAKREYTIKKMARDEKQALQTGSSQ